MCPVSFCYVKIRMADAAGLNLDQHLVVFRGGNLHVFYLQWFFEFTNDGCFHWVSPERRILLRSEPHRQLSKVLVIRRRRSLATKTQSLEASRRFLSATSSLRV